MHFYQVAFDKEFVSGSLAGVVIEDERVRFTSREQAEDFADWADRGCPGSNFIARNIRVMNYWPREVAA